MNRLLAYYIVPLLILLLPFSTWMQLMSEHSKAAIAPPALAPAIALKTDALLQSILKHNLWDKERGQLVVGGSFASATTSVLKACRLKGVIYAQLQAPQAMFECDKKLILLHEGEVLPDKNVLSEIHADHVVLIKADSVRELYLFGKQAGKSVNHE